MTVECVILVGQGYPLWGMTIGSNPQKLCKFYDGRGRLMLWVRAGLKCKLYLYLLILVH